MRDKFSFIDKELDKIKRESLYRKLRHVHNKGAKITISGKKLINLCSNDYLGIPPSKISLKQMQSSSRLVSGNDESFRLLEKKLAKHKSYQSSLIYPTGYTANLGTVSSLVQNGDLVCSDQLNHASIVEACNLSCAKISVYKHNNMENLRLKLKQKGKRKFIITEGVFSMDGDFADLKQIVEIAEKTNAIIIVDDAHGDFVFGDDGRGTPNYLGVEKKIDIYTSSLSKGLGSFGGYVASNKKVIDLSINKAKSFIYTSAIPSFLIDYSLVRIGTNRERFRKKLLKNIRLLSDGLNQIGYDIKSSTQIIPIIVGSERKTLEFGDFLYRNGVFAQPIRYPTVPKNQARIRISVTAWLTSKDIEFSLSVFEKAAKRFSL